MANINSNVITLKKTKKQLVDSSETWSGNKKEFEINTSNIYDLILEMDNVNIVQGTAVRYVEVFGYKNESSVAEYISGKFENKEVFLAQRNSISSRYNKKIHFDVREYKKVKVTIQLNPNQTLDAFVYEGTLKDKDVNLIYSSKEGLAPYKGRFNVSALDNFSLRLSDILVNRNSANRTITVKGINTSNPSGVVISPEIDGRETSLDGIYRIDNRPVTIDYNVSNFNEVEVEINISYAGNTGEVYAIYNRDKSDKSKIENTVGTFFTKGAKYLRFYAKRKQGTNESVISVSGVDSNGDTHPLTIGGHISYKANSTYAGNSSSPVDSFVDVSDFNIITLTVTSAVNLDFFISFFDDIDKEYARVNTMGNLVRGLNYVRYKKTSDSSTLFSIQSMGRHATYYDMKGEKKIARNVSMVKDEEFLLDARGLDFLQFSGLSFSSNFTSIGIEEYKGEDEKIVARGNTCDVVRINQITPDTQIGDNKAWNVVDELVITEKGFTYENAEHRIEISNATFPNLESGVTIAGISFIPWTRNLNYNHNGTDTRLCVQFSNGQIYHNYPKRSTTTDGTALAGDVVRFDESVVWDTPKSISNIKFPSKTIPTDTDNYYYDPTLSDDNYEVFPPLNRDNGYGNNGFGIVRNGRVRLRKSAYMNILRPLNMFQIDKMYTAMDSYRSNVKNCMFETSDGGREWFVQAEIGSRSYNYGNLDTTGIGAIGASVLIKKVDLVTPSHDDKDPVNNFSLSEGKAVSSIENKANPSISVNGHGLAVNDRVIFTGTSENYSFLLNNTHTEQINGNGQVYRVSEVVDANNIKIQPLSSNTNSNLTCAHVHSVNRIKDGWIMCTGEEYPNGWIFFIEQKARDFYSMADSSVNRRVYRLTSTNRSVQRLVGCVVLDDDNLNPTVIASMDSFNIPMPNMKVGDREVYSQSSGGIRIGKFNDLDDIEKFNSIVDLDDSGIGMNRYNGVIYAFGGGSGRIAVSGNDGKDWDVFKIASGGYRFPIGFDEFGNFLLRRGLKIVKK